MAIPSNTSSSACRISTGFGDYTETGQVQEERSALSPKLKRQQYDRGVTLLEPGVVLQSFFLIGAGVLSIVRREESGEVELLRLGPGDHFGEMGLLTGAASPVTIRAPTVNQKLRPEAIGVQ